MKLKVDRFFALQTLVLVAGSAILVVGCGGSGGTLGGGNPSGFTAANGVTGGKAYDTFWNAETGWNQADPNVAIFAAKADFFKCKQCHGWDMKGNRGFYISRAANANRPNVDDLDLRAFVDSNSPQAIFDAIKQSGGRRAVNADLSTYNPTTNNTVGDQMPNYGSFMTDAQIWNLVKFFKETSFDTSTLYDSVTTGVYPTGSIVFSNIGKDGSASQGDTIYTSKCGSCHGANGKSIMFGGTTSLGKFMRTRPNEAQHKIKFGQPNSSMAAGLYVTGLSDMKSLYKATQNTTKYPD